MGILNLTPDSFYDGGRYGDNYLERVARMLEEGAAIIDIGGASTRPGATKVAADMEWDRIREPLISIRKTFPNICISVDTYHAKIAEQAIGAGADWINDISGGTLDPAMPSVIGKYKVPYVIMHIQGTPANMQQAPRYGDVVEEINAYFKERIGVFMSSGAITLILDPGFGFGKTLEHNYSLLSNLFRFKELGLPVMAGLSRKSLVNKVLNVKAEDALNGTTVLNTIALLNGADILRVHDVKHAMEAIKLVEMLD